MNTSHKTLKLYIVAWWWIQLHGTFTFALYAIKFWGSLMKMVCIYSAYNVILGALFWFSSHIFFFTAANPNIFVSHCLQSMAPCFSFRYFYYYLFVVYIIYKKWHYFTYHVEMCFSLNMLLHVTMIFAEKVVKLWL